VKAIPEAAVLIMEPELKPGMVLSALVFSVLVMRVIIKIMEFVKAIPEAAVLIMELELKPGMVLLLELVFSVLVMRVII
jgi:hypothetical protein